MKQRLKSVLALLLSVMMIVTMSATVYANEGSGGRDTAGNFTSQSFTLSELYSGSIYRDDLSADGKLLYDALLVGMRSPKTTWIPTSISKSQVKNPATFLSTENMFGAFAALKNEWPELCYWADLRLGVVSGYNSTSFLVDYFVEPQDAYNAGEAPDSPADFGNFSEPFYTLKLAPGGADQKAAEAVAKKIIADTPKGLNDYEKVVYYNNWIIDHAEYDYAGLVDETYDNTFQIAGIFVDGKAVCEGYAKALKYLCDNSSPRIESLYVTGNLVEDEVTPPGPHAWNYVKLDGKWYIADPTNNDFDGPSRNIALCIGTDAPFSDMLVPDMVQDIENGVWVGTPPVTLSKTSYVEGVTFTPPAKLDYFVGEKLEDMDMTGGTVIVGTADGKTKTIDMTPDMLVGLDLTKSGEQEVDVAYMGMLADKTITFNVANWPKEAKFYEANVNFTPGISSVNMDFSKGTVRTTYADGEIKDFKLNDKENITITLPIGISQVLVEGKHDIEVTVKDEKKPLTVKYTIGVGEDYTVDEQDKLPPPPVDPGPGPDPDPDPDPDPTPDPSPDNGSSGGTGGGGGMNNPAYPSADKGIDKIKDIKTVDPKNLPAGVEIQKTANGASIAVIPVSLTANGGIETSVMATLGNLPATVGLQVKQGAGAVEMIIPGGFGKITEVGRLSYPMGYNPIAANAAQLKAAVKTKDAVIETCTLGGDVTLPVKATISFKTKALEGATVNVYRYDPISKKPVLVGSGKVVGGRVVVSTATLGQFMVTTGTI